MTDDSLVCAIREEVRRKTLDEYEIVDTGLEQDFDDLAALASYICGTPISAISLIDRDRQWFKASVGLEERETARDISFCQHTVQADGLFVVRDALEDERFKESPLVLDGPKVRFYAGAPLIAPNGAAVGALCVKDVKPRDLTEDQLDALRRLARQVIAQLELRKTNRGLSRQTAILEQSSADLIAANGLAQQAHRELEEAHAEIFDRLAMAAEYRDDATGQHAKRVSALSARIAEKVGLSGDVVERIRYGALLHDIGKVGIPDSILLKPGPLSPEEIREIQRHTEIGGRLLADSKSPLLQTACEVAMTHHERWDGQGYPAGLAGEAIPISGRIVAIADVFDALRTQRVYKDAMPLCEAIAEIARLAGTRFDPKLVATFLSVLDSEQSQAPAA